MPNDHLDGQDFSDLVSQIGSMSFDSIGLHWRYTYDYIGCIFLVGVFKSWMPFFSDCLLFKVQSDGE